MQVCAARGSAVGQLTPDVPNHVTLPIILWLRDPGAADPSVVGQKAARLGVLSQAGLPVPPGFVLSAHAYEFGLTAEVGHAARMAHRRLIVDGQDPLPVVVRSSTFAEDLAQVSHGLGLSFHLLPSSVRDPANNCHYRSLTAAS